MAHFFKAFGDLKEGFEPLLGFDFQRDWIGYLVCQGPPSKFNDCFCLVCGPAALPQDYVFS